MFFCSWTKPNLFDITGTLVLPALTLFAILLVLELSIIQKLGHWWPLIR